MVVEDIISMKKEEETQLRNAINYTAHHKFSKIFCVTHTIYKTGMFSMLPLFHSLIFTSSASNTPIVRAALNYFKIEKERIASWLLELKAWSKRYHPQEAYFFFDCTSMSFCMSRDKLLPGSTQVIGTLSDSDPRESNDPSSVLADRSFRSSLSRSGTDSGQQQQQQQQLPENLIVEKMKKHFSEFFQNHLLQPQALAIFSVMVERFGSTRINPIDLTITFNTKARETEGGRKKISTVDYIADLLTPSGSARLEHRVLHNYVSRFCVIPRSCIRNKAFLS